MKVAVWLSPDDTLAAPLPWGKHAVPGAARHLLSRKPFQAKWTAVTRVLADPEAAGALYLDVT